MSAATAAPYSVHIDPDTALKLATQGATVLLLDVPAGTIIGLDQHVFMVGPRFQGVKLIPPGVHFLSWQPAPQPGAAPVPVGSFLSLGAQQVVVRRWDQQQETLVALLDPEEEERYAAGVARFDFDSGLAPYPLAAWPQWQGLAGAITPQLLQRLEPPGGLLCILGEEGSHMGLTGATPAEQALLQQLQGLQPPSGATDTPAEEPSSTSTAAAEAGDAPGYTAAPATAAPAAAEQSYGRVRYTSLPGPLVKQPGLTPAQLSAFNLDPSPLLDQLLAELYRGQGQLLLGEVQYAFLAFLLAASLAGFHQWKALLTLLLRCTSAMTAPATSPLLADLLATLTAQLALATAGTAAAAAGGPSEAQLAGEGGGPPLAAVLVEELLPGSFLKQLLGGLVAWVREEGPAVPPGVRQQAVAASGLGWEWPAVQVVRTQQTQHDSSEEEDDEDGPVVVELTEEQLAAADAAAGGA